MDRSKTISDETLKKDPKCFIIKHGTVGKTLAQLVKDLRLTMSPNTAKSLKERRKNTLKDFIAVSGMLDVGQILLLNSTDNSAYLRYIKCPQGPTLTFKILKYSNVHEIIYTQKVIPSLGKLSNLAPVLIMNGFSLQEKHVQLMLNSFQSLFPSIDLNTCKIKDTRRIVFINYDNETKQLEWRHYGIKTNEMGISKGVKYLLQKKIKDFSNLNDISEFILNARGNTESDIEDLKNPENQLDLPEFEKDSGQKVVRVKRVSIRLHEIGPRMTLQLYKIEDGVNSGIVLYHSYIKKTEEEIALLKARAEQKARLKKMRKDEKLNSGFKDEDSYEADLEGEDNVNNLEDKYGNVEWYRKEVGEEPTEEEKKDLLSCKPSIPKMKNRKRTNDSSNIKRAKSINKKKKMSD